MPSAPFKRTHVKYYAIALLPILLGALLGWFSQSLSQLAVCLFAIAIAGFAAYLVLTQYYNLVMKSDDVPPSNVAPNFITVPLLVTIMAATCHFTYVRKTSWLSLIILAFTLVIMTDLVHGGILSFVRGAINRIDHFQRRSHEIPY